MAVENNKGFYCEFTRTPQEQKQKETERTVQELVQRVEKLEQIVIKMGGNIDE